MDICKCQELKIDFEKISFCLECGLTHKQKHKTQFINIFRKENKKPCFDCEQILNIYEFSNDREKIDGLSRNCKKCRSIDKKKSRIKNKDKEKIKPETKKCPSCKIIKSSSGFSKNSNRPDGLNSNCKECHNYRIRKKNSKKHKICVCFETDLNLENPHLCPICNLKQTKDKKSQINLSLLSQNRKICFSCNSIKTLGDFKKNGDKLNYQCKECDSKRWLKDRKDPEKETKRKERLKNKRVTEDDPEYFSLLGFKRCAYCLEVKATTITNFTKNKQTNDGFHFYCKPCASKTSKEHRNNNLEHRHKKEKEWRTKNRERHLKNKRNHYYKHHEKNLNRTKNWAKNNPEKVKKNSRKFREKRKLENPYWARFQRSYYRMLKEGVKSSKPDVCLTVFRTKFYFFEKCWICGKIGNELDHIKPISKGGDCSTINSRPICRSCNARKNALWPYSAVLNKFSKELAANPFRQPLPLP